MNILGLLSSLNLEATPNNGSAASMMPQQGVNGLFAALLANIENPGQQGSTLQPGTFQIAEMGSGEIIPSQLMKATTDTNSALFGLLAANDDVNPELMNFVEGALTGDVDETDLSNENLSQLAALLGLSAPSTDETPTVTTPVKAQIKPQKPDTDHKDDATAIATNIFTTVAPQPATQEPTLPTIQPVPDKPLETVPTIQPSDAEAPSPARMQTANTPAIAMPSQNTNIPASSTTPNEPTASGTQTEAAPAPAPEASTQPVKPSAKTYTPQKAAVTTFSQTGTTAEAASSETVSGIETGIAANTANSTPPTGSSTSATADVLSGPNTHTAKMPSVNTSTTSTNTSTGDDGAETTTNTNLASDNITEEAVQKTTEGDKAAADKSSAEARPHHHAAADRLINSLNSNNNDTALRPTGVPHQNNPISATGQVSANNAMPAHLAAQLAQNAPVDQIAIQIAMQARTGNQRFDIRLDPPELGRVDIRLEIDRDGQTLTHLAVEKPETLDMLQRDARHLERALQNAGLDSRDGSLSFSLRQDGRQQQQQQANATLPEYRNSANSGHDGEQEQQASETRTVKVSAGLDISI